MVFGLAAEPAALEHELAVVRPTGVLGDVACDLADQLTHPSLRGVGRPHLLHQRLQILGGVLSGLHHHEDDERLDVIACADRRQALGGLTQILVFRQELGGLIDVLLVHPDLPWRMPDDHRRGRRRYAMRMVKNSAGTTGAKPTSTTRRPLSRSSCVIVVRSQRTK